MKRLAVFSILFVLLLILLIASYDPLVKVFQKASITPTATQDLVIFPKGGEKLVKGQTYVLTWASGSNPDHIFLIDTSLESQGESVSIVDRVYNIAPHTEKYSYTVPKAIKSGIYKLQIGKVTSNPFQVVDSSSKQSFCSPKDIEAKIQMGAAAGNIYGTLTITNTSSIPCHIIGNNKINAVSSAKNISLNYFPREGQQDILLTPNKTLYAKVHYPNGPQCQSPIVSSTITFSYALSPTDNVTFANQNGKINQGIVTCSNANEVSQVDIWNLSTQAYN